MTIRQLTLLCAAAYYNPPAALLQPLAEGRLTLKQQCRALLYEERAGLAECGPIEGCGKELLTELLADCALPALRIVEYINHNATTGFVAYALRSEEEGTFLVFRGSESRGECVTKDIDWRDNFAAPFKGSVQYADIEAFVNRYRRGRLTLTGHSKGGHNALYALTIARNERAHCVAFNGQGFSYDQLNAYSVHRLQTAAEHYVVQDDPVGILLMHPEPRVFVEKAGEYHPHELCSYAFDEKGNPIPGKRPLWSYLLEGATTVYVNGHIVLEGSRVPKWLISLFRVKSRLDALAQ